MFSVKQSGDISWLIFSPQLLYVFPPVQTPINKYVNRAEFLDAVGVKTNEQVQSIALDPALQKRIGKLKRKVCILVSFSLRLSTHLHHSPILCATSCTPQSVVLRVSCRRRSL